MGSLSPTLLQGAHLLGSTRVCFPQELFQGLLSFWVVDQRAVAAEWQGPALPSWGAASLGWRLSALHCCSPCWTQEQDQVNGN